jgi:hypothetical protein
VRAARSSEGGTGNGSGTGRAVAAAGTSEGGEVGKGSEGGPGNGGGIDRAVAAAGTSKVGSWPNGKHLQGCTAMDLFFLVQTHGGSALVWKACLHVWQGFMCTRQ